MLRRKLLLWFGGPIGLCFALLSLPGFSSDVAGWASWLGWVNGRVGRWLLPILGFAILALLLIVNLIYARRRHHQPKTERKNKTENVAEHTTQAIPTPMRDRST